MTNNLPRIEGTIIFISGYYDGPLSGMCWIEGEGCCWFDLDSSLKEPARRHLIYRLTAEEFRDCWERHLEFEKYVGTHSCLHLDARYRGVKDRETHRLFYDKYKWDDPRPYRDREPIGKLIRV